ncbi:hypothetical protein B566_EDAN014391 [Ephemera danica]|nr:hypothetical protein B566_EDAN014391 [Ephemera danica]
MAAPMLRILSLVPRSLRIITGPNTNGLKWTQTLNPCVTGLIFTSQPCRCTSFFNKLPAESLWKGVTSVSNAGRKRGRGKGVGKKTAKNLNRGQVIGIGKANIQWPGLNVPVMKGRELVQQQQLPEDTERENKLIKLRDAMGTFRSIRLLPTERGWSGSKMPGRSIGPPDPVGDDKFEGFDTKVLEMKTVFCMKGNQGRRRRLSIMVVTGNMQGLAGFATAKAVETKAALRKAKNRSGQKMMYIELYKNHTVSCCSQFVMGGKLVLKRKKWPAFYTRLPSWQIHLKKTEWRRNHDQVRLRLRGEYGEVRSFLTDKHPEAKPRPFIKHREEQEATS